MEPEYITISQAAALTGKSQASIRRLVKNLLATDATTPHIKTEQLPNGSPKYYIASSYLIQPATQPATHMEGKPATQPATHMEGELIAKLLQQLDEKDRQIAERDRQIADREHTFQDLISTFKQEQALELAHIQERVKMIDAPRHTEPPIETEPTTEQPIPHSFFWQRKRRKFK